MATHTSVVFDQRNNYTYHSLISRTPIISGLPKNSQTRQFSLVFLFDHHDQEKKKINVGGEETAAQLKLVQEWRSMKTKNVGVEPSCPNADDEFLEDQSFLEEPVLFNFGDDYGNQLFLDLREELDNNRLSHGGRGIATEDINYTTDDIYILSPEDGMINSFLRDNLF